MDALSEALSVLPPRLCTCVKAASRRERISEIRLRQNLPLSVTVFGQNRMLDETGRVCGVRHALCATPEEIRETVSRLCEGSVYRHVDTLSRGYLVTEHGLRAGVCAQTVRDERGRVRTALSDFSGISLRIPYAVPGAADDLIHCYRERSVVSTLIYSAPGVGKTTLLRDLAVRLSRGEAGQALRVCVIDTRGELFPKQSSFLEGAGLVDVLGGIPKAEGIERATRLLSPQIILCDELGEEDDSRMLLSAQNSGVLFAASIHASSLEEVQKKPRLQPLIREGLFSLYCGIFRDQSLRRTNRLEVCESLCG